jgi:hypothetical protein
MFRLFRIGVDRQLARGGCGSAWPLGASSPMAKLVDDQAEVAVVMGRAGANIDRKSVLSYLAKL